MMCCSMRGAALILCAALAGSAAAQSLAGRVVNAAGVGIAGASLTFSNGGPRVSTDAAGAFLATGLSNRTYNTIDINPHSTVNAARRLTNVGVSGATSIGNIIMPPGALISGTMRTAAGAPVVGVNMNVYELSGTKVYTPNDGTSALGQFVVVAPLGTFRVVGLPPAGSNLVPFEQTMAVAAPIALGNVTLRSGFPVTGTVVDAVNGLPLAGVTLTVTDGLTNLAVPQATNDTTAFGAFSLVLPVGSYDIAFEAPAVLPRASKLLYGVIVIGQRSMGTIPMDRAVVMSGTVTGPSGPVSGADIDVYTLDGYKLFTPSDKTNATGLFAVNVPAGSYRVTVQPPQGSNLAGRAVPATVAASGSIGSIAVQAGCNMVLQVSGPNGPEVNADLDFRDPVTGLDVPLVGDHAGAGGLIAVTAPFGTFNVTLSGGHGSHAAPLVINGAPIFFPGFYPLQLPSKQVVVKVDGVGVQATSLGGSIPIHVTLRNLQNTLKNVSLDVCVRNAAGVERPVFTDVWLDLPGNVSLSTFGVFVPVPVIPQADKGRLLDYVIRIRERSSPTVLDESSTAFVVY